MRWFSDRLLALRLQLDDCDALQARWVTHTQYERLAFYATVGAMCGHMIEMGGVLAAAWLCVGVGLGLPLVISLALVPPVAFFVACRLSCAWAQWQTRREAWTGAP